MKPALWNKNASPFFCVLALPTFLHIAGTVDNYEQKPTLPPALAGTRFNLTLRPPLWRASVRRANHGLVLTRSLNKVVLPGAQKRLANC